MTNRPEICRAGDETTGEMQSGLMTLLDSTGIRLSEPGIGGKRGKGRDREQHVQLQLTPTSGKSYVPGMALTHPSRSR